jgi:hypothetical protein
MSSDKPIETSNICKTEGCNKLVDSRGFCTACYYRNLRNGNIDKNSMTEKRRHILININIESKTATCKCCGEVKIQHRGGGKWRCSVAANYKCKLYKRAYRQSKKNMLGCKCEICGNVDKLVWDHCHKNNIFRGTLCSNCNTALGLFKDDTNNLNNAINYLIKFTESIKNNHTSWK